MSTGHTLSSDSLTLSVDTLKQCENYFWAKKHNLFYSEKASMGKLIPSPQGTLTLPQGIFCSHVKMMKLWMVPFKSLLVEATAKSLKM